MAQPLSALGLADANEYAAYIDCLATSHRPRFRYDLFSIDNDFLLRLPAPEDGVIVADATADVTRTAAATLFDPTHAVGLDSTHPGSGVLPLTRILRIQHTVYVPKLARDVTATPFYGWLTKADRVEDTIAIGADGLERRARFGQPPLTVNAGAGVVDAIRTIMAQRCGETRFRFPAAHPSRLPVNISTGWTDDTAPWPVCLQLAASIGHQLFYSCDGWCTLRPVPTAAAPDLQLIWAAPGSVPGENRARPNITSRPRYSTDALASRNYSQVSSGDAGVIATATAPIQHPLSAQSLARNGVPFYMPSLLDDGSLVSDVEIQTLKAQVKQAAKGKGKHPKKQKGKHHR